MKQRTTTKKISDAISDNLLYIEKAEIYSKVSGKTDMVGADMFKENLDFLSESGVFASCIGWHYEKICNMEGKYKFECGRENKNVDIIVTAYLHIGEGVNVGDIDTVLLAEW